MKNVTVYIKKHILTNNTNFAANLQKKNKTSKKRKNYLVKKDNKNDKWYTIGGG